MIGPSEVKWSSSLDDILVTYALGSCVGVVLWDPDLRAGGMAHILLPSSLKTSRDRTGRGTFSLPGDMPGKYADIAVPYLVSRLEFLGCRRERMQAWIAGGARILQNYISSLGEIGAANVRSVDEQLQKLGIAVIARDVGGSCGRTMKFYVGEGRVTVSSSCRSEIRL